MGAKTAWFIRLGIIIAALFMIEGGGITDLIGIGLGIGLYFVQKMFHPDPDAQIAVKGAD